jgi:DNA-binding SARP family transcriptional activator
MSLAFGVLGEVAAEHLGRPVDLGSPQQRALFGLLMLADGRPVSTERLLERMWGPRIERTLRSTVRTYVLRLRRAFADVGVEAPVIETLSYGYRLAAHGGIDLNVFNEHLARARAARDSGDLVVASELLTTALGEWRGTPLAGARAFFVEEERSRLGQIHVAALEDRIQLDLELGRDTVLEGELLELVKRYPLRERLHEFLMLTLYRSGRQADALEAYQRVRRVLNDELGVAPGPGLSDMQRRILQSDPGLLPRQSISIQSGIRRSQPAGAQSISEWATARHQLPADTPDFTGRADLIARLDRLLSGERGPNLVGLCGLDGMGKSTLAVRVAHIVKERFPDGQFYADLRGETDEPVSVGEILGRFLRAMGLIGTIPDADEERAVLWRSSLIGRRILVVLDDATGAEQVQQILPASAGCAAIVTSVRQFEEPGLRWECVGPLEKPECGALFDKIVGPGMRAAEPAHCSSLLDLTGGYSRFVRAAGRRVLECPNWPLASVLEQLRENMNSPIGIRADSQRTLRAVQRSVALVDPEVGRAFRLLAALQVSTFIPEAVAALLEIARSRATAILHELAEVHLLICRRNGLFEMISPVRSYARAHAREIERPEHVRAAVIRMRRFYQETETNARMWRDVSGSAAAKEFQTDSHCGLRFLDGESAARWLDEHEIDSQMLAHQSEQFSPAHAPVVVSHIRDELASHFDLRTAAV